MNEKPAAAEGLSVPKPAGNVGSITGAGLAEGLQPPVPIADGGKASLGNPPSFPPAMFAALEDLSKKPIAGGLPATSRPTQPAAKPVTGAVQASGTAAASPRPERHHKAPPDQQAGFRARRPVGPASKIEALRERLQHGPSLLRRRGFHRHT